MGFTMSTRLAKRMCLRYGMNNPKVDPSDVIVERIMLLRTAQIQIRVRSKYTLTESLIAYETAPKTVTLRNRRGVRAIKEAVAQYYTTGSQVREWPSNTIKELLTKYISEAQRVAD